MSLEEVSKSLENDDLELARAKNGVFNNTNSVSMNTVVDSDLSADQHVVSSSMDDWEQPNSVVFCEAN